MGQIGDVDGEESNLPNVLPIMAPNLGFLALVKQAIISHCDILHIRCS